MIKTAFFVMTIMFIQTISSISHHYNHYKCPRNRMFNNHYNHRHHFLKSNYFDNDKFFDKKLTEPKLPSFPSLPKDYGFFNRHNQQCRRRPQGNKLPKSKRMPFPINPTAKDLLQSPAGAPNVLVIAESTMSSLKYSYTKKRVVISEYENNNGSEWSFEKVTETSVVQYRIRHVITGQYLVIAPNGQGYILTLKKVTEKNYKRESLWEMVRNTNGSYSFVSVRKKLAITRSTRNVTDVTLTPFLGRPCQCFYLYDWNRCRNRFLGLSK
jgi:hypothetical protein